ncbi:conserved hypothetical protein [Verticillium alfalfae VaMs.102]|uniref:J domain-containing protein n=1 Tax=Verticillium alfalfae (strain VaMs.102 / ATCC MYA-4576 / FGSC 10136) TaxID=526221 RepID=C9S8E6_VERA1|nr:conserved hypothetical protein [Verticillium alfalfae VaMs.102]EEY14925.1 conserved hypothetical protein [Verticillium alfalfae VaMs.102]
MPKLDNSRDYYADLNLPVTADVNDIKKQFRKLDEALLYHPDRNPGREAEVNSKFQVIQSAHEILTDPEQKAKYDASRGRSRYPTASGVRGNPWQDAGANFPPPPRRNQPTRNATQSGANKYRNFTSGAAPTAKAQPREDPMESRRNAWQAFEQMRPSSQGKSAASQAKPRPVPEQPVPPPRPAQRPERPVPRTPAQKQRAEAAFGPRSRRAMPLTLLFLEMSRLTKMPGCPQVELVLEAQARLGPLIRKTRPEPNRVIPPTLLPTLISGRLPQEQAPSIPRQDEPTMLESLEEADRQQQLQMKHPPSLQVNITRVWPTARLQIPGHHATAQTRRDSATPSPSGDGSSTTPESLTPFERKQRELLERLIHGANTPSKRQRSEMNEPGDHADKFCTNSFNFVVDDDTFTRTTPEQKRFARSSADDINTSFVDEQGADTWQFSAGSPHTPQQEDPFAKRRTQSASRTGRNSPLKRPPPRPAKEPLPAENEKTAEEVRFDAEGWSQKIGPQNFAHQPTQTKASSPTRPSRSNSRKPKSVHPTVGTAGLVNEESSSNEDTDGGARQPEPEPATTGSPMPMDIDPETPPPNPRSAPPSRRDSARNIPVEPSRPEWRPGNVQPVPETSQPNGVKRAPFNPNTAGSEDSEDFRASFADLKNVAPFATKPTGLNSFGDLKSQLPFESRASERIPIEKEKKQDPELNFPPVPRAPTPPAALAVSGLRPSLTTWQKYLVEFQNYLQQWDAFNAQITYHFEVRKAQILEERGTAGYAFLTTQGDEGVEQYLSWVRQDKEVRRKWSLACDEHEMRMLDFLKYKKLMR